MNTLGTNPSSLSSASRNVPFSRASNSKTIELDPMRTMWDALAQHGFDPQGDPHNFRARCPAHNGEGRNLQVTRGVDGRVLLYCISEKCDWRAIADAVDVPVSALFPPGHKRAEKHKPRPVKTLLPGPAFLDAMSVAGFAWHAQLLGVECPYCSDPNAYITVHDLGGIDVNCPNACTERNVRESVETRAAIAEKGVQLR